MSESASSVPEPLSGAAAPGLGARAATAPFQLSQEPVTPEGPRPSPVPGYTPAPAYEYLGELPATYGAHSLYLVAYDPRRLFAYWDIDWAEARTRAKTFALEVHRANGSVETQVELTPPEASRYLDVRQPGAQYSVRLTSRGRDGRWRPVATSGFVTMPPEGVAQESDPAFATLPFHLSFQRLMDLLKAVARPREALAGALARLQQEGQLATVLLPGLPGSSLGDEPLHTLELLARESFAAELDGEGGAGLSSPGLNHPIGGETLSSGGLGSELRLAGAEVLSSQAVGSRGRWIFESLSSETLSSSGRLQGPLLSAAGMGSESLTSRGLTHRAPGSGAGLSSETLSSTSARGAAGSEWLGRAATPGLGLGVSSEAWRRAGGPSVGGSENLASDSSSAFVRAVQRNLGALFRAVDSRLSGERPGGGSSFGSGGL